LCLPYLKFVVEELAMIKRYNGSQRCIKPASPQENSIVLALLFIDTQSFVSLIF